MEKEYLLTALPSEVPLYILRAGSGKELEQKITERVRGLCGIVTEVFGVGDFFTEAIDGDFYVFTITDELGFFRKFRVHCLEVI